MSHIDKLDKVMKRRFGVGRVGLRHGPLVDNVYYNVSASARLEDLEKFAAKNNLRVNVNRGASDVVIEVPHQNRTPIFISDLLTRRSYQKSRAVLPMLIGVSTYGRPIVMDLKKTSHILIGGRAKSGKSTFMNGVVESMINRLGLKQYQFILIDTRNNSGHLHQPVITDCKEAMATLNDVVKEADARLQQIKESNARNIEQYNKNNTTPIPYMVVVIDEFADLMKHSQCDFECCMVRIAQKVRTVGIYIIMATEYLNAETITGPVRAVFPTRVVFRTDSKVHSKAVLGEGGAERLAEYGDALFSNVGRAPIRIHTPCIGDADCVGIG